MIQDCIEKRTKEYLEWYDTIAQQIEKVKKEIVQMNEVNRIIKNSDEQLQERKKNILFDLKYKKRVGDNG